MLNHCVGFGEPDCIALNAHIFGVSSLAFRFPLARGTNGGVSVCSGLVETPPLRFPLVRGTSFVGSFVVSAGWGCVTLRVYGGCAAELLGDICDYTAIALCFFPGFGGIVTVVGWLAL